MATKTTTKKTSTKKATAAKQAAPKTVSKKTADTTPATKTNGKSPAANAKQPATKQPAAKKQDTADKKLSALDAAAKVLGEAKEPLNAKTMIERMATKGYWTSPGGKTPHSTLYAAMLREINAKGKDARFAKTDRGLFTLNK